MFLASAAKRLFSTSATLKKYPFMQTLGLAESNPGVYRRGEWVHGKSGPRASINPHNNQTIAHTTMGNASDYNECVDAMQEEKTRWMNLPMPARGEIVRQIGCELRAKKDALGSLISLEVGKIKTEGNGEV